MTGFHWFKLNSIFYLMHFILLLFVCLIALAEKTKDKSVDGNAVNYDSQLLWQYLFVCSTFSGELDCLINFNRVFGKGVRVAQRGSHGRELVCP